MHHIKEYLSAVSFVEEFEVLIGTIILILQAGN